MQQVQPVGPKHKQPLIPPFTIQCSGGSIAQYMCSTEDCGQTAFICNNRSCVCRKKGHVGCKQKVQISYFTKTLEGKKKEVPPNIKIMFDQVIKLYDDIIEKLSEDRLEFIQYTGMFGLTENMIRVVRLIDQGRLEEVEGQTVFKAWDQIQSGFAHKRIYSPVNRVYSNDIRNYQLQIQNLLNKLAFQLAKPAKRQLLAARKFSVQTTKLSNIFGQNLRLELIPVQLLSFPHLRNLTLANNAIRKIDNLDALTKLENLTLSNNYISKIQNMDKLTSLESLKLDNNRILALENLGKLKRLERLILFANRIKIVQNLQDLNWLNFLDLRNNPLEKTQNGKELIKKMTTKQRPVTIRYQWDYIIDSDQEDTDLMESD